MARRVIDNIREIADQLRDQGPEAERLGRLPDDTAKLLGALPDLADANFAGTKLTDAGVKALAAAPKIRQIDARETKATKEGAERAKMGRARLEIRVE